jgi:hypothetical protein
MSSSTWWTTNLLPTCFDFCDRMMSSMVKKFYIMQNFLMFAMMIMISIDVTKIFLE